MIASLLFALALQGVAPGAADESAYYTVDHLVPPEGAVLEVGGMDFLPDGSLVVSTRRGQLWQVHEPLAEDPAAARFELLMEGLHEGLGLQVYQGEIHVLQRGELSRLRDYDGDGRLETVELLSNEWGLSGNYHEFAFGLPQDDAGNFYLGLNVAFFEPKWWHGKSPVPLRGWVLRVSPRGETTPFALGFRSPCGLGRNAAGELFVTDNQGDWVASSPIYHLKEGAFYGHPASLRWTPEYGDGEREPSDTIPPARERTPPAVWIPYDWSRSTGNLVHDGTGGRFGPFDGQLFVAELTNGLVLRADLEKVRGEYQGAVFPFRANVGSVARVRFAPDGTLFCGLTNRGWGGRPPSHGIARVRWTGRVPFEIESVRLFQSGFELALTEPLHGDLAPAPEHLRLSDYDYDYWWEYGSPERDTRELEVASIALSPDRTRLVVNVPGLEPARVVRARLEGLRSASGNPLLHPEFAYTVNQLPEGPATSAQVAKAVPPPPARESGAEGWLRLTWGDALDAWHASGWRTAEVEVDPAQPRSFQLAEGDGALVNLGAEEPSHLVSRYQFGDAKVHVEFQLPEQGNSGVYLMGRYEIQLLDSPGGERLGFGDCGGIYRGASWPGRGPKFQAYRGAGQWHSLDAEYEAPRFDSEGNKLRNARLVRARIDDVLLHENVELPEPTAGALFPDEAPQGPLMLQGDHGPVAYRNLRVFAQGRPEEGEGWTPIFDGESLEGWKISDGGDWSVEDGEIVGRGARSHLFSPRDDYRDFELAARVQINDQGNSGLYFRTAFGPGWPAGHEAQINSSYQDPQKTGSLYGLAPIHVQLVPPDTWFDYRLRCEDTPEGTRIRIAVNGVELVDHLDTERRHAAGHVALQQHHDGSVVRVSVLRIRELD